MESSGARFHPNARVDRRGCKTHPHTHALVARQAKCGATSATTRPPVTHPARQSPTRPTPCLLSLRDAVWFGGLGEADGGWSLDWSRASTHRGGLARGQRPPPIPGRLFGEKER